jgi:hypothetical protein
VYTQVWLEQAQSPDQAGWIRLILQFDTFESARDRLLSFGGAVEVLELLAWRLSIQDFSVRIVRRYPD